jgi:hypothetical protein
LHTKFGACDYYKESQNQSGDTTMISKHEPDHLFSTKTDNHEMLSSSNRMISLLKSLKRAKQSIVEHSAQVDEFAQDAGSGSPCLITSFRRRKQHLLGDIVRDFTNLHKSMPDPVGDVFDLDPRLRDDSDEAISKTPVDNSGLVSCAMRIDGFFCKHDKNEKSAAPSYFFTHVKADKTTPSVITVKALEDLRKKVGTTLLANMPILLDLRFDESFEAEDCLPIVLFVGDYSRDATKVLQGLEVWVIFTDVHLATEKKAPTLQLTAWAPNSNAWDIKLDIPFSQVLDKQDSVFNIHRVFANVQSDEDFKAVAKYYFLLAAQSTGYHFQNHHIPTNDTFVRHLHRVARCWPGNLGTLNAKRSRSLSDTITAQMDRPTLKKLRVEELKGQRLMNEKQKPAIYGTDESTKTKK